MKLVLRPCLLGWESKLLEICNRGDSVFRAKICIPVDAYFMGHCVRCVCVFFQFILDIKFVGRTSRGHRGGRSHRISHPPFFCGACLSISREKDPAFRFPRRPRSRILCTYDLIVLHLLDIFICICLFFREKKNVYRDRTHVPTCQKVTRLFLSYWGDRVETEYWY